MDKVEEILPRICEYLSKDLAREPLSPLAEATRLFYVERLKVIYNFNEDRKYENNGQSQIQLLKNLIGKKLGGEIPEKKNGLVKNDSPTNLNDQQLNNGKTTVHSTDNKSNSNDVSLKENQKEQIKEYYDSEFDTSDEESARSSTIAPPSAQKSYYDELFSSATFKGEFYQNILLKMRRRTCYLVGSEIICISKSRERYRFSLLNCRTSVKQHEGKYPIEVRVEPVFYSISSYYTTDTQLAWRFVKAIKDAAGTAIKKEKSTDCDSALIPLLCVHG